MKWMKWAVGGVALMVVTGGVVLGVASIAQAQVKPEATKRTKYDAVLAEKLGVSVEKLQDARKATRDQLIDEAVADGRLTQAQADAIKDGKLRDGLHGMKARIHGAVQDVFQAAADVLGITKEELRSQLAQGKTPAQLASERNVPRDTLKSGIADKVKAQLAAAVSSGDLTQVQAGQILSGLDARLDKVIDGSVDKNGFGGPKGPRPDGAPPADGMRRMKQMRP